MIIKLFREINKLVQHTRFECLRERTISLLEVLINIDFLNKVCVKIYKHY